MAIINQVVSGGSAPETQFGVNLKGWCGDIITSGPQVGQLRTDQAVGTLNMAGVTQVGSLLEGKFDGSTGLVGAVNLSNLLSTRTRGLKRTFAGTRITSLDLSSVNTVSEEGMQAVCEGVTTLTSVTLPSSGANGVVIFQRGLQRAFKNTAITTFTCKIHSFGSGEVWDDAEHLQYAFDNCSSLRSLYFPSLSGASFSNIQQMYEDMEGESLPMIDAIPVTMGNMVTNCSNVTIHLPQQLEQDLIDDGEDSEILAGQLADIFSNFTATSAGITVVFDL